jgi:phage shock protein A
VAIKDPRLKAALADLRGGERAVQDAVAALAAQLDSLITQVGNLKAEVGTLAAQIGEMATDVEVLKRRTSPEED